MPAEKPLFDGDTLAGWHRTARVPVPRWPGAPEPDTEAASYRAAASSTGRWEVLDGSIVASQDPPGSGLGGYLVTDETFADFELRFDVHPDWPADTGVLVRATEDGTRGFQILIDFRKSGGIGGFYGNGIGGFHALSFGVDAEYDSSGAPVGLRIEDPATTLEPITADKPALLSFAVDPAHFVEAWNWDDWNSMRIRCVGEYPVLTTWLNGVELYSLDTGGVDHSHYDREAVAGLLGRSGHIALEVHDFDARMGAARWGRDAVVRWRNLTIEVLQAD